MRTAMTDHAVLRYVERIGRFDPADSFDRAEAVDYGLLMAEAKRCGRKWRFHRKNVLLRDAQTGAVFVCRWDKDTLLAVTVVKMRVPKPKKKRTSRLCRDMES